MYSQNYGLGKGDMDWMLPRPPEAYGVPGQADTTYDAPERIEGEPALLYALRLNDWRKATNLPPGLDQYYKEQSIAIINSMDSGTRPTGQAETVNEESIAATTQNTGGEKSITDYLPLIGLGLISVFIIPKMMR